MKYIFDSLIQAFVLIGSFNIEILRVSWTSLWVTGAAITLAAVFSLPAAFLIATNHFKGKRALVTILNTLLAIPTVVVGLLVYSFLCSKGILGNFEILYTPFAMIIGQFILASPIITALTISALEDADERIEKTALTLGATKLQALMCLAKEVRAKRPHLHWEQQNCRRLCVWQKKCAPESELP